MSVPVADKCVGHTVPVGTECLVGDRGEICRGPYDSIERLLGRVEGQSQCIPRSGFNFADDFPVRAIADCELSRGDAAINRDRLHDAPPQIEPIRAGLLAGSHGAKVDRKVHLLARGGTQPGLKYIPHSIPRRLAGQPSPPRTGWMHMSKRTLRFGQRGDCSGRHPGGCEGLAKCLTLEC